MKKLITGSLILLIMVGCTTTETSNDSKSPTSEMNLWTEYAPTSSTFKLWSPEAEAVRLFFYENGQGGSALEMHSLELGPNGTWTITVDGDLAGVYYTFQVNYQGAWLEETPGIYATAVGVNGQRAMVIDMQTTNPEGWNEDTGPELSKPNEAIIYELHIRDMTIHPESGSSYPGKYLGLVESGTTGPEGVSTAIDHIKELGITHVHLLPTYDHYSIDETKLDSPQFNWGYDPQNYNVPEGSFSMDPYHAEVRIREFKEMVKAFHDNGIGVILDVVYNHTGRTEESNFNQEYPGYYYRQWDDGQFSDASACGNETASDKEMMRTFILESVKFWAREYHLDGFRFDLMAIHDVETMNQVATSLKEIDPRLFVYGEGWTAGDSPLPVENRALKAHAYQMENITVFSDDLRDGLKGSVFDDLSTGFVTGASNLEESIKFGIVGSIEHPEIDYAAVNYSDAPYTNHPWQAISYVSCHDNHTLFDKLTISRADLDQETITAMHKLANAIVLTSQGTGFLHAGVELMRTKFGEHNSYNLPDSINQMNWSKKIENAGVLAYYRNLIALRKSHPAFWMSTGDEVREKLSFQRVENGLVSFQLNDHANGDAWKSILVVHNARTNSYTYDLTENWKVALLGDDFSSEMEIENQIEVPALSTAILYQQ